MKRLLILLALPILACGGLAESVSPTVTSPTPPTVASVTQTDSLPMPDPATAPPIPTANPIANAGSFPSSDDYQWITIASGLNRPVDIQPANDGSGRLFIIEKFGVIRVYENGQLLDAPSLISQIG